MKDGDVQRSLLEYFKTLQHCRNMEEVTFYLFLHLVTLEEFVASSDSPSISNLCCGILSSRDTLPLGFRNYSYYYDPEGNNDKMRGLLAFSSSTNFSVIYSALFLIFVDHVKTSISGSKLAVCKSVSTSDTIVHYPFDDSVSYDLLLGIFNNTISAHKDTSHNQRVGDSNISSQGVELNNNVSTRQFSTSSRGTSYRYEAIVSDGKIIKIRFSDLKEFTRSMKNVTLRDDFLRLIN